MTEETLNQIGFNIVILGLDIPKEDQLETVAEIAVLAELDSTAISYFIIASMSALESGYEEWKEVFAMYVIASGNSELIINLNKLF